MESALEFKVFDWLRFPLIVGVVIIHCYGKPFDFESLDFANLSGYDVFNLFRVSISQVLTHVCVPTFYFISGFLFFKGLGIWNNRLYKAKIKRRVKSLLLPYLIWNTIYIIVGLISAYRHHGDGGFQWFFQEYGYWHLYWDCHEWNNDRLNWIGGGNSSTSPYLNPLWFLRDLMVITLFSPILYVFLRKLRAWGVLLLGFCYISGVFINIPGFSITAFFFFAMGAYVKLINMPFIQDVYRYKGVLLFFAVLLWIICTLYNGHNTYIGNIIYPFYVIVGFLSLMSLATYMVKKNIAGMRNIPAQCSFFIYLSHYILIRNTCMKISAFIFGDINPICLALSYVFAPILTIIACAYIYYILRRRFPAICSILTGYR